MKLEWSLECFKALFAFAMTVTGYAVAMVCMKVTYSAYLDGGSMVGMTFIGISVVSFSIGHYSHKYFNKYKEKLSS